MLRKKEIEMLRRGENVRMWNIQSLAMKLPLHSPSSSKCEEGKQYHEKMQFVHSIIQNIYKLGTSVVEFLRRQRKGWSSNKQGGLGITLVDLVCIHKLDEKKGVEQ